MILFYKLILFVELLLQTQEIERSGNYIFAHIFCVNSWLISSNDRTRKMNNDILSEGWGHFLLMKGGSFDTILSMFRIINVEFLFWQNDIIDDN